MHGTVGDIQMHWRESGRGEAVVFVHGFPFHGGQWDGQIGSLPARWRLLAPDLRGFGRSEAGVGDGPLEMDLLADDLATFMDMLEIERAVICGTSMGGYIALALWRWHPERVRALVLSNTRATADTEEVRAGRRELARQIERDGTSALFIDYLPSLLSERTLQERPGLLDRIRSLAESSPPQTFIQALDGMALRPDSTEILPTIDRPTLLIGGSDDQVTPPSDLEFMDKTIPDTRLKVLEGSGHLSSLETPASFNLALVHFLEAIDGH